MRTEVQIVLLSVTRLFPKMYRFSKYYHIYGYINLYFYYLLNMNMCARVRTCVCVCTRSCVYVFTGSCVCVKIIISQVIFSLAIVSFKHLITEYSVRFTLSKLS